MSFTENILIARKLQSYALNYLKARFPYRNSSAELSIFRGNEFSILGACSWFWKRKALQIRDHLIRIFLDSGTLFPKLKRNFSLRSNYRNRKHRFSISERWILLFIYLFIYLFIHFYLLLFLSHLFSLLFLTFI